MNCPRCNGELISAPTGTGRITQRCTSCGRARLVWTEGEKTWSSCRTADRVKVVIAREAAPAFSRAQVASILPPAALGADKGPRHRARRRTFKPRRTRPAPDAVEAPAPMAATFGDAAAHAEL